MKTILAEDRQKKEKALTVLMALMTGRRTHDKAIVYLLSHNIVRSQYIEEDIGVSIEYLRSVVLKCLKVRDRMGTLKKDKECALSRVCFEGIWNVRGRLEAAGENTLATDGCFTFTEMQAVDKQLDTAACTLNRAAEFWRRSKEAKDTEPYSRLLRGHLEKLCKMADIFNQANLVVESTTKQGTSQCTDVRARAAKAGRKLGELNRLHQRIILGQQAQAESYDPTSGESQSIVSKYGLDDHPQALVKRGEAHPVRQEAQAEPDETKAGGDEATIAKTPFEEQSQAEAKAEEL